VKELGEHMRTAMYRANGIGLASNQVGVRLRILVHKLIGAAPEILVNPVVLMARGSWRYSEGCLSLQVDGAAGIVKRPQRIMVAAHGIDGSRIALEADELLARILQHELDHLEGIEYVQQLDGDERDRVYDIMRKVGIDVSLMPPLRSSAGSTA
jgi:peptide deformylase